ncbi:chromosome segregation protein SMC [Bacteroidia bacterium]|nr:chromosome segregation protein SMC [Bacteroidia bacterium]
MKLEKINIQNYRCFSNYEIEFTSGVNVLIGKNGVGKTTIINAIKHGLSFVFAKTEPADNQQSIATSAEGLTIEKFDIMDALYDETIEDYRYPIAIQCNAMSLPPWEIYKESAAGRILWTKYKEAHQVFEDKKYLPILAIYSDSYPHLESALSTYAKKILGSGHIIPKNFGYYQWGAESSCAEVWEQRFINLWEDIKDKRTALQNYSGTTASLTITVGEIIKDSTKENSQEATKIKLSNELLHLERERETITNFLINFSNPISTISTLDQFKIQGLEVNRKKYLNVRFVDGRSILFQNLPAGYKRLFSIVLDIAYRAYILQLRPIGGVIPQTYKNPEEVTGIVVIDEIDLHLHPSLEQEVIERLQNTFPNIQFIVSTHSNLVIANLKENEGKNSIIKLDCIDGKYTNQKLPNLFGIGYEACLSDFMGTPPRNSDVKYLAEAYIRLEKRQENKQAGVIKKELTKLVGDENVTKIIDSFK